MNIPTYCNVGDRVKITVDNPKIQGKIGTVIKWIPSNLYVIKLAGMEVILNGDKREFTIEFRKEVK